MSNGVQVRILPDTARLMDVIFTDTTVNISEDIIRGNFSCFDELGVKDLDIDVTVTDVWFEPRNHYLQVTAELADIEAYDLHLYTDDPEFDGCPTMDWILEEVRFNNPRVVAKLGGYVEDGKLVFELEEPPEVSGDLVIDHPGFLDDLIIAFFEEEIVNGIGTAAINELPPLLTTMLADMVLSGDYGNYHMDLELESADLNPDRFDLVAAGKISWLGQTQCPAPPAPWVDRGRSPTLDLSGHEDATVAIGLTEEMLNDVVQTGYEQGWWCLHSDLVEQLLSDLQDSFDPVVGILDAEVYPTEPPVATVSAEGTELSFKGLQFWLGPQNDPANHVVLAEAEMTAKIDLGINQELTSFNLSLHDMEVEFVEWDVQHVISDREGAEERMKEFFETWVIGWIEEQTQKITLFAAQYHAWELVVRVEEFDREEGGIKMWLKIFHKDDPEVDLVPPEVALNVSPTGPGAAQAEWSGTDDREGVIAYSYRVDVGSWSVWNTETGATVDKLAGGTHVIEVRSRDQWLNISDVAGRTFDVEALPDVELPELDPQGCACVSGTAPTPAVALGALMGLLLLRRRR